MALGHGGEFDKLGRLTALVTQTEGLCCHKTGRAGDENELVEPPEAPTTYVFVATNSNNMRKGCRELVCDH